MGYKSTLKSLRSGKAKLVLIAGNTPPSAQVGDRVLLHARQDVGVSSSPLSPPALLVCMFG